MILSLENKNKNNFILYSTHIFVSLHPDEQVMALNDDERKTMVGLEIEKDVLQKMLEKYNTK